MRLYKLAQLVQFATSSHTDLLIRNMINFLTEIEVKEIATKSFGPDNFVLTDFKIEPWFGAIGYLGEHFRLTINAKANGKKLNKDFFVKTVPTSEDQLEMVMESGVFLKEIEAYNTLFNDMRIATQGPNAESSWHPKCFFSRPDIVGMLKFHLLL